MFVTYNYITPWSTHSKVDGVHAFENNQLPTKIYSQIKTRSFVIIKLYVVPSQPACKP